MSSFSISSILNENIEEGKNLVLYNLYIAIAFYIIYLVKKVTGVALRNYKWRGLRPIIA